MKKRISRRRKKSYFRDLREFISLLDQTGNLHRISARIEKNSELMPLVRWQYQGLPDSQRKAFLFENVTDPQGRNYNCRVAVGVLGASRKIYRMALGADDRDGPGGVAKRWNHALSHPIPPRLVKKGPVKEEQVTMDFAFATVVTIAPISTGEAFTKSNIWVKRPGTGAIPAERYEDVLGKQARRDLAADTHLKMDDIA